jgi:hypothetical protein
MKSTKLRLCILFTYFAVYTLAHAANNQSVDQANPIYIEESKKILQQCKDDPYMGEVKCDCYASKYLEERVSLGPETSEGVIKSRLRGKCADVAKISERNHKKCLEDPMPKFGNGEVSKEDYCACVTKAMFIIMEEKGGLYPRSIPGRNDKAQIMIDCQDPAKINITQ